MANLIRFNNNHELQFECYCRLSINKLSSILVIEPENEAFKMISASFKWKYLAVKNILFVIADFNFLDFCLVFANEAVCKKVLKSFKQGDKCQTSTENNLLERHFLFPIMEKIQSNPPANFALVQIFGYWIYLLEDEGLKPKLRKMMQDMQIYGHILAVIENQNLRRENEMPANDEDKTSGKKRKFSEISQTSARPQVSKYTTTLPNSQFKLMKTRVRQQRKLIIFTSKNCTRFHEFKWHAGKEKFVCSNFHCRNSAIIDFDENAESVIKLNSSSHACMPSQFIPKGYSEITLLKKPNYEVVEKCSTVFGTKTLIIFDSPENREMCYKYYWITGVEKFVCVGCRKMNCHKTLAKVCNEGTEKEYIELLNCNHVCKKVKHEPEKLQYFYNHILRPDFEIQSFFTKGREMRTLVIFNVQNPNLCYVYYEDLTHGCFLCRGCRQSGKNVKAKLRQNADKVEYVVLANAEHVCKFRPYISQKEVTFRPPEIQLMEDTKTGAPKIFIFVKNNPHQCYMFTPVNFKLNASRFHCMDCFIVAVNAPKEKEGGGTPVTGYLRKEDGNNNIILRMKENQLHICGQPRKYEPEKYQNLPKTFDIFFYRPKKNLDVLNLAIFCADNKTLCYAFGFQKSKNMFVCSKCKILKTFVGIGLQKDVDGKEYFHHDSKRHVCKPIQVSTISGPDYTKLESSGLNAKERKKRAAKPVDVEETQIVRIPNYTLLPCKNGKPAGKLLICNKASEKSQKTFYEFLFQPVKENYYCIKCMSKKHRVMAKIQEDKNREMIVILGTNHQHVCEPQPYEPPKIVEHPNFKILKQPCSTAPKKLVIFTSESHDLCYHYSQPRNAKAFKCLGCNCWRCDRNTKTKNL